jgi:hypothetical protein
MRGGLIFRNQVPAGSLFMHTIHTHLHVLCTCIHGHGHGHGIFILATYPEGTCTEAFVTHDFCFVKRLYFNDFYAFYAFYAWWIYFPHSGALAEGTSRPVSLDLNL